MVTDKKNVAADKITIAKKNAAADKKQLRRPTKQNSFSMKKDMCRAILNTLEVQYEVQYVATS